MKLWLFPLYVLAMIGGAALIASGLALLSVVWLVMYGGLPADLMVALWLGVLARLFFCAGGAAVCGALRLERRFS